MGRFKWIVGLGAGILGWVAGEMMLKDEILRGWIGEGRADALHWVLPAMLGVLVIVVGRLRVRQASRRRPDVASRT